MEASLSASNATSGANPGMGTAADPHSASINIQSKEIKVRFSAMPAVGDRKFSSIICLIEKRTAQETIVPTASSIRDMAGGVVSGGSVRAPPIGCHGWSSAKLFSYRRGRAWAPGSSICVVLCDDYCKVPCPCDGIVCLRVVAMKTSGPAEW